MAEEQAFGLLNVDKPAGLTSHDVVEIVRRGSRVRKVGHAGTLDPMASGVLVLCLGPATRLSEYVMLSPKRYRAEVCLGATTSTYDTEGEITARYDLGTLDAPQIEAALAAFRGEIQQIPPMYSAIKQGGRPLYKMARAGQEVEREARAVTIHDLRLAEVNLPRITLDVVCSPGTYIRSLAHDLGVALGVGGYLSSLVREASGAFRREAAVPLDSLRDAFVAGDWRAFLLPPELAVADWPVVTFQAEDVRRVRSGNPVAAEAGGEGTTARAHGPDGGLAALVRFKDGAWWPLKVFSPEG